MNILGPLADSLNSFVLQPFLSLLDILIQMINEPGPLAWPMIGGMFALHAAVWYAIRRRPAPLQTQPVDTQNTTSSPSSRPHRVSYVQVNSSFKKHHKSSPKSPKSSKSSPPKKLNSTFSSSTPVVAVTASQSDSTKSNKIQSPGRQQMQQKFQASLARLQSSASSFEPTPGKKSTTDRGCKSVRTVDSIDSIDKNPNASTRVAKGGLKNSTISKSSADSIKGLSCKELREKVYLWDELGDRVPHHSSPKSDLVKANRSSSSKQTPANAGRKPILFPETRGVGATSTSSNSSLQRFTSTPFKEEDVNQNSSNFGPKTQLDPWFSKCFVTSKIRTNQTDPSRSEKKRVTETAHCSKPAAFSSALDFREERFLSQPATDPMPTRSHDLSKLNQTFEVLSNKFAQSRVRVRLYEDEIKARLQSTERKQVTEASKQELEANSSNSILNRDFDSEILLRASEETTISSIEGKASTDSWNEAEEAKEAVEQSGSESTSDSESIGRHTGTKSITRSEVEDLQERWQKCLQLSSLSMDDSVFVRPGQEALELTPEQSDVSDLCDVKSIELPSNLFSSIEGNHSRSRDESKTSRTSDSLKDGRFVYPSGLIRSFSFPDTNSTQFSDFDSSTANVENKSTPEMDDKIPDIQIQHSSSLDEKRPFSHLTPPKSANLSAQSSNVSSSVSTSPHHQTVIEAGLHGDSRSKLGQLSPSNCSALLSPLATPPLSSPADPVDKNHPRFFIPLNLTSHQSLKKSFSKSSSFPSDVETDSHPVSPSRSSPSSPTSTDCSSSQESRKLLFESEDHVPIIFDKLEGKPNIFQIFIKSHSSFKC